ncbi:MAG: tetratricopeptide repeat protein [Gammaproteobacteria bacterium]|jgi:tetratricopeptide (TPR) repeat protein|nr:tetratricopeptide repeat protein [Gammaproteobacteria bacterium]
MPNRILFRLSVILILLLTASAAQSAQRATERSAAAATPESSDAATATEPSAAPPSELSADLVYAALAAEVALQREAYGAAFDHFLRAARLAQDSGLAERAVRAALRAGDSAAARQALELWIALDPVSSKAHQLSAFLALEADQRTAAIGSLLRVIDLADSPKQGYLQAAQILGRLPVPAQRLAVMRELVTAAGAEDQPDAQFALATLAAAAGQVERATELAERAAALRPGWTDPQVFLVRLLVTQDRGDEARAALERYIREAQDARELKLLKAQLQMDAGESEQALTTFEGLLEDNPQRPDILFAAAVLALEIEDLEAARGYLETLQGMGKRPDDVAFLLGQVEESADNNEAALALYEQVGGQNRVSAQVRIANLYAEAGAIERAREVLQQLRDQHPDQVSTLYLIEGELLREQGLEQQAFDVYSSALSKYPDNADLLYARAMMAVGMDKVSLLEQDLRRILVDNPDHVDALNALGYTLADRTDRFDAALALIERALQLRPDDPAILDSMGWVLYRKGRLEAAEEYLRRALEQGFDAEIAAHLGEVLWSMGRRDEAREVWGHALNEDPEHEYLQQVLSRFRFSQTEN